MVWRAIARKEVRGVLRPRSLKAGLAFVALVFVVGGYLLPTAIDDPTTTDFTGYVTQAVVLVVPLFGLLLGYKTIVAERASGRLTLLLSLPHSRREAVLGKFLGRGSILAAVVGVGVFGGVALAAYPFGTLEPWVALGYLLVTVLYGAAFLGTGIALSTLSRSNRVTTTATFGVFFLFVVAWGQLLTPLRLALDYVGWISDGLPDWALFAYGLEPTMLYRRVLDGLFAGVRTGPYLGPDASWYLGAWPALALLAAWTVLPVALGYARFRVTDL